MRRLTRATCLLLLASSSLAWAQQPGLDAREDTEERIRRLVEQQKEKERALASIPVTLDRGASVNPALLESITDNSIGLRFEERNAYFRVLELAKQTPLSEQVENARDFREARRLSNPRYAKRKPDQFPSFVDMFQNPDAYRGRPVSLHGVLRKLTKFDPGKNDVDIQEVYEGWVYTDDGQSNPAVVVFLSKPEGLKVGGDLTEEVRLTGYFFKMYGYEAQDVARKAPMILAGEVEWKQSPKPYKPQALGAEVYLLVTMVVLVLGFVVWQGNRREMSSAIHPRGQDETPPAFPPVHDE